MDEQDKKEESGFIERQRDFRGAFPEPMDEDEFWEALAEAGHEYFIPAGIHPKRRPLKKKAENKD